MFAKSTLQLGIGLFVFALALAPVSAAHAGDAKGISATSCQPFLPTTYSQALFKDNAIYNPTATNQRVICPIQKDTYGGWAAGDVNLIAYIRAGSSAGKVSCTVYGGGAAFGQSQVAYTATSAVVSAGASASFEIEDIADPDDGLAIEGWNVLCTLNPGMSLGGFFIYEAGTTDNE